MVSHKRSCNYNDLYSTVNSKLLLGCFVIVIGIVIKHEEPLCFALAFT